VLFELDLETMRSPIFTRFTRKPRSGWTLQWRRTSGALWVKGEEPGSAVSRSWHSWADACMNASSGMRCADSRIDRRGVGQGDYDAERDRALKRGGMRRLRAGAWCIEDIRKRHGRRKC